MPSKTNVTFGLIVGNRGFFPDELAREGHAFMTKLLKKLGYGVVVLSDKDTKYGSVETWDDAKKCAELFKKNKEKISGVIVTLPNFGDERGISDSLKLSGLDVPVLVHAWQDDAKKMSIKHRRDSFCGKMSACNNLRQYDIPFSLTAKHTLSPETEEFENEVNTFAAVCRVVAGMRSCRVGQVGARPAAFNTVRYSEKLLQESGITVETIDLSEIFGRIARLSDNDAKVKARVQAIQGYANTKSVPKEALLRMAKLAHVIDEWKTALDLNVTALQCWTSMEEYFGIVPCTVMSMMSEQLASSACETDVAGVVSMHALALASQSPSFLLDWNNNYGDDPDKCVCFHCANMPKSCYREPARMDYQEIIAGTVGKNNTYGALHGRIKTHPMTYCRMSTFDNYGMIRAYLGEGEFTNDPLDTFGGVGVAKVPNLQGLLQHICQNGYEHHVAANFGQVSRAVYEAFTVYLGWDCYWHQA